MTGSGAGEQLTEVRSVASAASFLGSVKAQLVLDQDLVIVEANRAYRAATGRSREDLVGRFLFDAFPDNPDDPTADGVANLTASLLGVFRRGQRHVMAPQRYDIQVAGGTGPFEHRVWQPVNLPITDVRGRPVGAVHDVTDITAYSRLLVGPDHDSAPRLAGLETRAAALAAATHPHAGASTAARLATALVAQAALRTAQAGAASLRLADLRRVADATGTACSDALCVRLAALPGIDAVAAMTTLRPTGLAPVAASGPWAASLAEVEATLGEGPSQTAKQAGLPVICSDIKAGAPRWPMFAAVAAEWGVTGVLACPAGGRHTAAVLTAYSRGRLTLPRATFDAVAVAADLVTDALLADLRSTPRRAPSALQQFDTVEVAVGFLAERLAVSTADAFVLLRAHAFVQHRSLVETATEIIETGRVPEP